MSVYNTPPCEDYLAYTGRTDLINDIHDSITHHREELRRLEGLGKEICQIVDSRNKRNNKTTLLYKLSHKIVASVYVLRARVILRIVRGVYRCLIV